jgi:hypothetical protein
MSCSLLAGVRFIKVNRRWFLPGVGTFLGNICDLPLWHVLIWSHLLISRGLWCIEGTPMARLSLYCAKATVEHTRTFYWLLPLHSVLRNVGPREAIIAPVISQLPRMFCVTKSVPGLPSCDLKAWIAKSEPNCHLERVSIPARVWQPLYTAQNRNWDFASEIPSLSSFNLYPPYYMYCNILKNISRIYSA